MERVLHSAVRLVGRFPRFGYFSGYMRVVLHCLHLTQRIIHKVYALVWRRLLGSAPAYLRALRRSTLNMRGRRSLRSFAQSERLVP